MINKLSSVITERGNKGVFKEQSSLTAGQKEKSDGYLLEGYAMFLVMRTALTNIMGAVSVALRRQYPFPTPVSDMGFHQQFVYLKPLSP